MERITFANPDFLYLLILLVPMIVWYILKQNSANATIQFSSLKGFQKAPKTYKYYLRHALFAFRLIAISALIVVLARPQTTNKWEDITTEGIDVVIALDISGSMLAQDFRPNRLEASKNIATEFISGRELDRMGLVVFSGESFTQCPLTTDHAVLINLFRDIKSGMIEDGTAIGLGLANAVNRLKDSEAISRVVILLTDGENNAGEIDPITAAELAKTFGIRVYTVGVGSYGTAPYQFQTPFGPQVQQVEVKIDEKTLKKIAEITDSKYFRATNNQKLKLIYKEIDALEKSKIEVKKYSKKQEEYFFYAVIAFLAFGLEVLLRYTIFRNIP